MTKLKTNRGYSLVNNKGYILCVSGQLPIYWYKKVALEEAKKYNAKVKKVFIDIK